MIGSALIKWIVIIAVVLLAAFGAYGLLMLWGLAKIGGW